MSIEQDFVDEARESLQANFQGLKEQLGDIWEKEKETLAWFAESIGRLNYRIFMRERVDTSTLALEDIMIVGLPALRLRLRYHLEIAVANTVMAVLGAFARGAITFIVAAGKSYLESQEFSILETLQEKVKKI